MTPDELQAALDAATRALREDELSPAAERFAINVTRLVAEVSALRDVLAQTERERDEARARIARYVAALDEGNAAGRYVAHTTHEAWLAHEQRLDAARSACDAALAALRETPAGEGER